MKISQNNFVLLALRKEDGISYIWITLNQQYLQARNPSIFETNVAQTMSKKVEKRKKC